jgi:hypothetical protein
MEVSKISLSEKPPAKINEESMCRTSRRIKKKPAGKTMGYCPGSPATTIWVPNL